MGRIKYELQGKKFGRLLVESEEKGVRKNSNRVWNCLCDCGNTKQVSQRELIKGDTKSCGCLAKESQTKIAYKLHEKLWNGRFVPVCREEIERLRKNGNKWRAKIRKRDNFCCVLCNEKPPNGKLDVHHIQPMSVDISKRNSMTNMVSLCKVCHFKVHDCNWTGDVNNFWSGILQAYADDIESEECQFKLNLL